MDTIRRIFTKKVSKDFDRNSEDRYSVTEDFARQVSTASDGVAGNSETSERRRIRSLSISRSGRYKQKRRERGALQDRPDLYQSPSNQETTGESKQDNQAAACRQTTTVSSVPAGSEGTDLFKNISKRDSASEPYTGDEVHENATGTYKQTTASSSNNNNSISKNIRAGCKGAESGGRLTTQTALV